MARYVTQRKDTRTCSNCGKTLPNSEFFLKEKTTCVDCYAAKNGGKIHCRLCSSDREPSEFSMLMKNGRQEFRMKTCVHCRPAIIKLRAHAKRRRKPKNKICAKCVGPPTIRDHLANHGDLTDGLCSNCYLSPDVPVFIDDIINSQSMVGSAMAQIETPHDTRKNEEGTEL